MRSRITIITAGALSALALVAVPATAATDIHNANLNGSAAYPGVHGDAKYGVDNGVRQLEAEFEDANAIAGQKVKFVVDGVKVAATRVDALGAASIDREGGSIPQVVTGSKITVKLAGGGTVASGQFN